MDFRKKSILVLYILISIGVIGIIFTSLTSNNKHSDNNKIKIVTSFYPIYIATSNIVSDIDNIELTNLTGPQTGCLHDYQLTPHDMITLETADIFIINGGGMESFIEDIIQKYPDIILIDSSEGIELLESSEHEHNEHEENNAHIWLNTSKHIKQIENIKNALIEFDNNNMYNKNAEEYISKLETLNQKMHSELESIQNRDIIIFHDSFEYFAEKFGLDVKHTVVMEADTSLSSAEVAEIIDEINEYDIKILFTEAQYSEQIASAVAKETDAKVYILDSCVSGDMDKNAYITAMERNLKIMKGALK